MNWGGCLIEMRVHKHKRGVNCVAKFPHVSRNKLRPCSDMVFITSPEQNAAKMSRK